MGKIYCIYNTMNHKKYIGQTKNNVSQRFAQHIDCAFRTYKKKNNVFYKEIVESAENVYKVFNYKILEICDDNILDEREIYYIKKEKPEYNEDYKHLILESLYGKDICKKYKNGKTITELRKEYTCRHDAIRYILTNDGIPIAKSRPSEENRKKVYLFDDYGNLIKEYSYCAELGNDIKIGRDNVRICALENEKKGYLYYKAKEHYISYLCENPYCYKIININKNVEILCKTKKAVELEIEKLIGIKTYFSRIRRKGRKKYYGYEIIELIGGDDDETLA